MTKSEDKSGSESRRPRPLEFAVQKIPWSDIRRQMITSLSVAFGALIGFMWQSVVQQAFTVAGVITSTGIHDWASWIAYAVGAIAVTFIAVIMILIIARGQAKTEQKKA